MDLRQRARTMKKSNGRIELLTSQAAASPSFREGWIFHATGCVVQGVPPRCVAAMSTDVNVRERGNVGLERKSNVSRWLVCDGVEEWFAADKKGVA
jgi:hypothetical protein